MTKPFADMPGGEILEFLRDEMLWEAARKRSYLEATRRIAGLMPAQQSEIRHMKAVEAVAMMLVHLCATGDRIKLKQAEQKAAGRKVDDNPEWLMRMVHAARVTLAETDAPRALQDEPEHHED